MTTNAWAHLPNAKRIDRILEDTKFHSDAWDDAWDTIWDAGREAELDAARAAAGVTDLDSIVQAVWRTLDRTTRSSTAWTAATDATDALIAWDDCAYILDLHPNVVRLMAASGNQPAILLEAAVIAMHEENV